MPADHEGALLAALKTVGFQQAAAKTAADLSGVTRQNIWRHPDAHPVALDTLMLQQYGPEWLSWEPETLQHLVPDDFKTQVLSELNLAKLQACKVLHLVDSFWQRWEVFAACAMPFNNEFTDFHMMQVPTAAQALVACDIAARIRDDVQWSEEMRVYVGTVYRHDGIFLALPPTDFAKLDVPDTVDAQALAAQWPPTRVAGKAPTGESILDEQLRRLLIIHGFLEESRTRLRQQLQLHA